ncbi:MAG: hypothetical protein QMD25_02590 [Caldisericia bacterium]|nr:hypothetical protein [Caldisericia bacterium]
MKKIGLIDKIIAITGTVLIWIPIIAPLFFALLSLFYFKKFRFDYLMTMEFFLLILIGVILLIIVSLRTKKSIKNIVICSLVLIGSFFLPQLIAQLTGVASGETELTTTMFTILITFVIIYILALIILGVFGILLVKKLVKS